jgi:2-deoxy-D-gluconate 3-dehydrogenase
MSDFSTLLEKAAVAPSLFHLKEKTALVVGGNKGLGQAMALALASAGADVCIAARGPAGLQETAEAITSLGRQGTCFAADVSREDQVSLLFDFIRNTYGKIDILVNSQGAVHLQESTDFDMEAWQKVMDVNLKSVALTCKYAGRMMLPRKQGRIINISSVRGFQGRAQDLAYAPSKGAVNQLTKSLAIEWGPLGINVNAIAPAFTLTDINAKYLEDPAKKEWALSRIPMKRLGELEDFFGPVIFLASDASNFVNGHTLPVDGGWLSA